MKFYPTKIIKLISTTFVIFLFFSCSKDTDLLTDLAIEEAIISETILDSDKASITIDEDKAVSFNMLNNTTGKGNRRQYKSAKQPKNGGLVIKKDSIAIYTPDFDFNGKDAIEITLEETNEDNTTSDVTMTVDVTVNPTKDVVDDKVETDSGIALLIEPLKNDTFKPESGVKLTETSTASKGSIELHSDNTITYTPNVGANGIDLFTYTTEIKNMDDSVTTETGNITVTINGSGARSVTSGDMGPLKAFPTAYGGGSNITGGRGGQVILVTNLNANGSGSLKAALESDGPANIVFDVSGIIHIPTGGWLLRNITNKTILGQTAPRGGITVTGGRIRFENASNLIIRHIRSRPIKNKDGIINTDDDGFTTSFLFYGAQGIILDHVSASFSSAKAINMFGNQNRTTKDITVSNSLISDSNTMVTFGVNPGEDQGQCGNISFIFNLIGNAGNRTPNFSYNGYGEILNNVIHGGNSRLSNTYYNLKLNHIGNYYKRWPGAPLMYNKHQNVNVGGLIPEIYSKENYYTGLLNGTSSEDNSILWKDFINNTQIGQVFFSNNMNARTVPNPSPILTPQEAYNKVINDVGANKFIDDNGVPQTYIDDYDQSVINNVINNIRIEPKNGNNWKLPAQPQNSRPNNYDTDNDGIADAWEFNTFGNLNKSYNDQYNTEGYTVLEAFVNQVDFN